MDPKIKVEDTKTTIGSNHVLLNGYPYGGYLGHYNGYLNGLGGHIQYPYPYRYLSGASVPKTISGTVSYVVPNRFG